jgi:hypothetical protein
MAVLILLDFCRVVTHGYSVTDGDKRIAVTPSSQIKITCSKKEKNWVQTIVDMKTGKVLHGYVRSTRSPKG